MSRDYLDDVIEQALHEGRTVELVLCDDYGYGFEIDGTRLFDMDHGLARETFDWPLKDCPSCTDESLPLVEELLDNRAERFRKRRVSRWNNQTETHRAAEGQEELKA